jgi:hypothetical protein
MAILATMINSMEHRAQKVLDEVSGVASLYGITSYELTFLRDMVNRHISFGTKKQQALMSDIEDKVTDYKGDNDD